MPRLLQGRDFRDDKERGLDPRMYFKDAYWVGSGAHPGYRWETLKTYPYYLFLVNGSDDYSGRGQVDYVEIRRWVERQASGDVYIKWYNLDYEYVYVSNDDDLKEIRIPPKLSHYSTKHRMVGLYFEKEEDATLFTLAKVHDMITSVVYNCKGDVKDIRISDEHYQSYVSEQYGGKRFITEKKELTLDELNKYQVSN